MPIPSSNGVQFFLESTWRSVVSGDGGLASNFLSLRHEILGRVASHIIDEVVSSNAGGERK